MTNQQKWGLRGACFAYMAVILVMPWRIIQEPIEAAQYGNELLEGMIMLFYILIANYIFERTPEQKTRWMLAGIAAVLPLVALGHTLMDDTMELAFGNLVVMVPALGLLGVAWWIGQNPPESANTTAPEAPDDSDAA